MDLRLLHIRRPIHRHSHSHYRQDLPQHSMAAAASRHCLHLQATLLRLDLGRPVTTTLALSRTLAPGTPPRLASIPDSCDPNTSDLCFTIYYIYAATCTAGQGVSIEIFKYFFLQVSLCETGPVPESQCPRGIRTPYPANSSTFCDYRRMSIFDPFPSHTTTRPIPATLNSLFPTLCSRQRYVR